MPGPPPGMGRGGPPMPGPGMGRGGPPPPVFPDGRPDPSRCYMKSMKDKDKHSNIENKVNLTSAWQDFDNIRFMAANFMSAEAENSVFKDCNLIGVQFGEANLAHSNFQDAVLDKSNFSNSDLQGVNMGGSSIKECDFTSAKNLYMQDPWSVGTSKDKKKKATFSQYKLPQRTCSFAGF